MIKSMTGYGKSEINIEGGYLAAELSSLNSRYIDISLKMPEFLKSCEEEIRKLLSTKLIRGRICVTIKYIPTNGGSVSVNFNNGLIDKYYQELQQVRKRLHIQEEVNLNHLLTFSDLFIAEKIDMEVDKILAQLKELVSSAIVELDKMRKKEGDNLSNEISDHLNAIKSPLMQVRKISSEMKPKYFEKFTNSIRELCENVELNEDRILQEAAQMSKKIDISEECERIESHLDQFNHYIQLKQPVGKQLNFLVQELHREVSTIGSKSEHSDISHYVVEMKNEIEKIREQIQNIL